MKGAGIKSRVMLIALLPALILAILLTTFHARNRINSIEQAVLAKGRAVAQHLAPGSEFGVVTGNHTLLASIASAALQDDDFVRIVIRDTDNYPLMDRRQPQSSKTAQDWLGSIATRLHPLLSSNPMFVPIRAPIYRIQIEVDDEFAGPAPAASNPQIVGWIELEMSLLDATRNQFIVLMESLLIVFAALCAAAVAGGYVGRNVVRPIRAMTQTVGRITLGDLEARAEARVDGELGQLQAGINQMAEKVAINQQQLKDAIDKATDELKDTMAELERRNLDLDEARLDAVRVSDFKSQFLANVSHEIRTPMNAILGFTELLARSSKDPVQQEFLDTILSSADSLLTLLNEILDLSRIESGRMQLNPFETDISNIINEVYQLFLPQAVQKNLEFFADTLDPALTRVVADPLRLKQVLVNLISNALKFTDDGYVLLRTTVNSATPERLEILFSIEDSGCGIAEATQRKLFRAFSQGDMSTTRAHGGSGLGLHIASELVFMMGGEISVDSAPGLGATFSFKLSLPRNQSNATNEAGMPPAAGPSRQPLLLTNAYPPFSNALRQTLERAGFRVYTPDRPDYTREHDWLCILDYCSAQAGSKPRHEREIDAIHQQQGTQVLAWVGGLLPEFRPQQSNHDYHAYIARTPDARQTRKAIMQALDVSATAPKRTRPRVEPAIVDSRGSRLLVVDDHPLNLKLIESLLVNSGYTARCSQHATAALELARSQYFDAVLLDIHMPHLSGFSLTRELRKADSACRDSIIIALTADAYAETARQAQAVGMNDILVKPVSQDRLLAMLDTWLDPASSNNHPSPQKSPSGAIKEPALAAEMRVILQRMLPMHRGELTTAYDAEDWSSLRLHVHKIRGATTYCDVAQLTQTLTELQTLVDREAGSAVMRQKFQQAILLIDAEIDFGGQGPDPLSG